MKKFTKVNSENYELSRVQDAVQEKFSDLDIQPFLNGNLIKDVSLVSGVDNLIPVKLSRIWELWTVVRKSATADIWEGTQENTSKFLNLRCSANCTVSLWVA